MEKEFKEIRITDNFYQSSSFFPMPLTLIGTLNEDGSGTSFGAYSLVFPYYIAGKDYYAMVLECRNTSNTAKGILRHGKCTINFLPFSKSNFEQHVLMGFPGDTPEEKMKQLTKFTPIESTSSKNNPNESFPKIGTHFGGRDHSTIMSSYRKIVKDLKTNEQLKVVIKELKDRLST